MSCKYSQLSTTFQLKFISLHVFINQIQRIKKCNGFCFSLSGLSPFAGENDIETLKNVKACDWDFDEESFAIVSDEGKDFIRRLLMKNKE